MRECGVLLPVSSLPSRYGIGAFTKEAYEFIDKLKEAGQQYWQILPLGPTGFGDSPYQAFSAFAGNPYFIDLEQLTAEGLLKAEECDAVDFGDDAQYVDYGKLYDGRFGVLRKAYERWKEQLGAKGLGPVRQLGGSGAASGQSEEIGTASDQSEVAGAAPGQAKASGAALAQPEVLTRVHRLAEAQLSDETREYCFYMAIKNCFGSKSWNLWDEDIRLRKPEAVSSYKKLLSDEVGFYEFQQLKFEEQWRRLKDYAHLHGIKIIGDIPIYVAFDGADSWAHPELFQFDGENLPVAVAGCPPDAFSVTGQLWGNPLYNWSYHKSTGYRWWLERMSYSFQMYDVVRVDHFRGFDEYYSIPYGDATAEHGHWEPGPGMDIFQKMEEHFGKELPIIAEDLGFLTPTVLKLLKDSGFPGMKVLEFAFDDTEDSAYLIHKYPENCVVYTGTHDNDTLASWCDAMNDQDRSFAREYMGSRYTPMDELYEDFIRLALISPARLAVIPAQDYLGLGGEARINEPSTLGKNWRWRLLPGQFNSRTAAKCRRMARLYGRGPRAQISKSKAQVSKRLSAKDRP